MLKKICFVNQKQEEILRKYLSGQKECYDISCILKQFKDKKISPI